MSLFIIQFILKIELLYGEVSFIGFIFSVTCSGLRQIRCSANSVMGTQQHRVGE